MKKDWKYKKLGEVCEVFCDGDWIESKDQSEDGIRLIQTGNVGHGVYRDKADKSKYISEETFKQLNCTEIFPGDILVSRLPDPIGRACVIPDTGSRMITAVDCSIIRLKECINSNLFVYYTRSDSYSKNIDKFTTGTTRKRISRSNLSKISVPIPPMEEQQQIVAELNLLSTMIEKQKAQIEELDKLSQSIFYDMFDGQEWEVKTIKDIAFVKIGPFGSALHQHDYIIGGTPLVNPIHMSNEKIIVDNDFTISDEKKLELSAYLLKTNDVVFGRRGDIGRCALVTEKENGYLCGTGSLLVRFSIPINPLYSIKVLSSPRVKQYLLDNARGATMLNLNSKVIEGINIPLPPLSLQQEFAAKIEAIEAMKAKVRQSLKEAETLFNSRMDYYFN